MPSVEHVSAGIGQAVLLRIPEMDPRLVARLDRYVRYRKTCLQPPDHRILGLP